MPIRTGVDLVFIPRIQRLLERHGQSFTDRFFTPHEREHAQQSSEAESIYALCWGTREAGYKVGGGRLWSDYRVCFRTGRPRIQLSPGYHTRRPEGIPPHARWDLSWCRSRRRILVILFTVWQ